MVLGIFPFCFFFFFFKLFFVVISGGFTTARTLKTFITRIFFPLVFFFLALNWLESAQSILSGFSGGSSPKKRKRKRRNSDNCDPTRMQEIETITTDAATPHRLNQTPITGHWRHGKRNFNRETKQFRPETEKKKKEKRKRS